MNDLQRKVIKATYKPNCYVLVSGSRLDPKNKFDEFDVVAHVTFLYDAGNIAAEWEPEHGPVQLWDKCEEGDEGASEHYYFDYTNSPSLNCSYAVVEDYRLPQAFYRGDYDYIFKVLEDRARR